jgi:hypothetical protein
MLQRVYQDASCPMVRTGLFFVKFLMCRFGTEQAHD